MDDVGGSLLGAAPLVFESTSTDAAWRLLEFCEEMVD